MTPGQAWACQDQGGQQRHAVVPGGVTDRLEDGSLPSDRISQGSGAGRRCGLPAQGSPYRFDHRDEGTGYGGEQVGITGR